MLKGTRGEAAKRTVLTGKAGEYIVAGELLMRGMNIAQFASDTGVDILTENGCRVQVKTGRIRNSPGVLAVYKDPVYSFHFPKMRRIAASVDRVRSTVRPQFEDYCDVVVLFGVEQRRFWVIPSNLLKGVQALFMGPKNARTFDSDMINIREMVKLGFSQTEIGRQYGMSQAAISHRLKASEQHSPNSAACSVRNCEDAWENILDFPACKLYSVSELTKEATDAE